jgi:hypothetical protein
MDEQIATFDAAGGPRFDQSIGSATVVPRPAVAETALVEVHHGHRRWFSGQESST